MSNEVDVARILGYLAGFTATVGSSIQTCKGTLAETSRLTDDEREDYLHEFNKLVAAYNNWAQFLSDCLDSNDQEIKH